MAGADRDGGGSRGRLNVGSTSTFNPERTIPALGDTLPCPSPVEELLQAIWDDPGCVPCGPCRRNISRLAEIAAGVVRQDGARLMPAGDREHCD